MRVDPHVHALAQRMAETVTEIGREEMAAGRATSRDVTLALAVLSDALDATLTMEAERLLLHHIHETFGIPL